MNVFYSDLARWWPLVSPVEDYADEAREFIAVIDGAAPTAETMLELGSGGGHNAFHMKRRFEVTLSDLSQEMLDVSLHLNPECEHIAGDMRTIDLQRQFDVVFLHDAIDYMTTEADLSAAIATAYRHCRPGGIAVFVPDAVTESFEPSTDCGGSDAEDGRGLRYLEWSYDPDPNDTVGTVQYAFVVREVDGSVRTLGEEHHFGLFSRASWVHLLEQQGFVTDVVEERTEEEREPRLLFIGRRPTNAPYLRSSTRAMRPR